MGYKSLQHFVDILERQGELVRIKEPVSPYLEITEITDRVSKKFGPALLFENVPGYEMPVLMNAFGSMRRMCLALEVNRLEEISGEILSFLEAEAPDTLIKKLKLLPKLARLGNIFPRTVSRAPCQEVIFRDEEVDLTKIPVSDLLAPGRRPLYHPAPGDHPSPRDRQAQHGHVPPAGL
jgi:4-hydroxy-3-polyprenylbenzoate decarboxylase